MKVIDILVKWANGEKLPNKIKILENANDYETEWYLYNGQSFQGYAREWDGDIQFFLEYITGDQLNAEIEVLEKNNELEKIRWEEKEILAGSLINN